MRYRSARKDGFQVFAVTGINTISFGISASTQAQKGLLGFAIEREDPTEEQRYWVYGFKVFRSVVREPQPHQLVSTYDHPIQSFVWDDFTAKPDREYTYWFHPIRGTPKKLDRSAEPISIRVATEPLFSENTHDVFFNRGVASSQAYEREFGNQAPGRIQDPDKRQRAMDWLSRDLDEAILRFIQNARKGDTLLGCFYEFRYEPVAAALKNVADRGVHVRLIVDGKRNAEEFPRSDNLEMLKTVKFPRKWVKLREARRSNIQHNKFMVLLKGPDESPAEVWTGSTNMSVGGVTGQTNVGHWVRDHSVAAQFRDYWHLLAEDPGGRADDDSATARRRNAELRAEVGDISPAPDSVEAISPGVTVVFSPRGGGEVMDLYTELVDSAESCACITLAFGVNKNFKQKLVDNTPDSSIIFLLLEKEDKPNSRSKDPFVDLTASHNVYEAWGAFIEDPVYQWAEETNARILQLNKHVSYVHSKFLLRDALGDDPIVVTGSANFSDASVKENDENMLFIRGDTRVADIYFTEFNRLFNHYYFRAIQQKVRAEGRADTEASLFLAETPSAWLRKYRPGLLRAKRLKLFTDMQGTSRLT